MFVDGTVFRSEVMLEKIKNLLLYGGLTKTEFKNIEKDLVSLNRKNLRTFSAVAGAFLAILFLMSNIYSSLFSNQLFYLETFIGVLAIYIVSSIKKLDFSSSSLISVYAFLGIIFSFGISLGMTDSNEVSATFIALVMVAPLLFYDRPLRVNVFILYFTAMFIILAHFFKVGDARTIDIVNAAVFGILSCVINTCMLIVKVERVAFANRAQMFAETDVLTDLKNRNCYESNLYGYANSVQECLNCVYVDVNGLHEVNNTEGHKAGDVMLQTVASLMKKHFGEDAYRIGGDEFIAFVKDKPEIECKTQVKEVLKKVEEKGYHISVGIENASISDPVIEIDMDKIVRAAEEKMYDAKRKYYQRTGYDRRRR